MFMSRMPKKWMRSTLSNDSCDSARTVISDGISTIPLKRPAIRVTRDGSPPASEWTMRDTASASVAVPCRISAGRPASRATLMSVWIGFQI